MVVSIIKRKGGNGPRIVQGIRATRRSLVKLPLYGKELDSKLNACIAISLIFYCAE